MTDKQAETIINFVKEKTGAKEVETNKIGVFVNKEEHAGKVRVEYDKQDLGVVEI